MSAEKCPDGFHEYILGRDKNCLRCGISSRLQLHHLIGRGKCSAGLRWDSQNIATLCAKCHQKATENRDGGKEWNVTAFGDQRKSLELFWLWFRQHYPEAKGGWRPSDLYVAEGGPRWPTTESSVNPDWPWPRANLAPSAIIPTDNEAMGMVTIQYSICRQFKGVLHRLATDFLEAARLADQILEHELWKGEGCETITEFLEDPEVGLRRTRFYRFAQVGRLLRLSGATDIPPLAERRWIKGVLPVVKWGLGGVENVPEVIQTIHEVSALCHRDFEARCHERRNQDAHPNVPCGIPQDSQVFVGDQIVGRCLWAKVGPTHHTALLAIANEHAKTPLSLIIR